MNILILKNVSHEGPGTIEEFLKEKGIPYRIVDLSMKGEVKDASPFTHLVMMGGPMAVYEMDRYDFLKTGARLLEEFLKKGKGVLGVCLGAQMMAHVLGGRVYPGSEKEIGWYKVDVTDDGEKDPLYPNQAFRWGQNAYALQFHIEVTPEIIEDWFRDDPRREEMAACSRKIYMDYSMRAFEFYRAFFET